MAYPFSYQPTYQQYFPANYQPAYQQPMQQPTPQQAQAMQQPNMPMPNQIQNGGFVTVRSEAEARNYPVAPGNSVTFKHETAPYCYTKTMGFSQFEAPRFEKYKLVKEEDEQNAPTNNGDEIPAFATKAELGAVVDVVKSIDGIISGIKSDIEAMKGDLYGAVGKRKTVKKQTEGEEDE